MQASNQVSNLSDEEQNKVAKAFQRPERPFFAKIHRDKIILPVLAAFAFFGAILPNAVISPTDLDQQAIESQSSEQDDQERRNAEMRLAKEAADQKAAEEQAAKHAQEESNLSQKADAEKAVQAEESAQNSLSKETSQSQTTTFLAPSDVNGKIAISSGFGVLAPDESKQLLTAMVQQASSAFKISEIKGKIEALPKPATGDRKTSRKLNDQGLAAMKAEDFTQAISALKSATASDPADVEVLNNYVFVLIKGKRIQDAESEAGRLLTMSPGRSSAWANLAEIYALKNKKEESVAALVLAFQFSSNKDRTINFLNEKAADPSSPLQFSAKRAIEVIQNM
jgi:predicted Zn-dependent protease